MKRILFMLMLLASIELKASTIDLQKISNVYKTDYFTNTFVNGSYIYT